MNGSVSDGAIPEPSKECPPILVAMLRNCIASEASYPSRPEFHLRLQNIENAAQFLEKELSDLRMLGLLFNTDGLPDYLNEMYHGFSDIAARSAAARAGKPRKQGRGKLHPKSATGPSAFELCALIAAIFIHARTQEWPPHSNPEVRHLCERLWIDAGGRGRKGVAATNWRNQLRRAEKFRPPDPAGAHVLRVLTNALNPRRPIPPRGHWVLRPPVQEKAQ